MKINIKDIKIKSICATLFISLFLSCNNGIEELERQRDSILSISNLRQGFLDIFTSFGDMLGGVLGIKADTKKSEIGDYFTNIANTMKKVKDKLISEIANNENYAKVKTVVDKFITGTLDKIAEGSKIVAVGAGDSGIIGDAEQNKDAVAADTASVKAIVKGIKAIVDMVLKDKGNADANATKDADKANIGKLFTKTNDGNRADNAAAQLAAASIGAITGADILQAIIKSKENPNADGINGIENAKDAAEIAIAPAVDNKKAINQEEAKKDAVLAAGIALRAMAKNGKFAVKNTEGDAVKTINSAAASAVTKALNTLNIAIRNTVDSGLRKISEALAAVKQGSSICRIC
ncbi:variable large family protein (plasmid) [Borrelia coriaceae]|uniref:Variable large protein n=1 Tax=Borrelia coriaceae ATCC 43381 TaxID=1408429 RepID=W5T2B4_9SPIR|nr:variable large family protein [Borrelia coriaceae]AHH11451.1 Variable outer membrane protein [Borrelia coriaceae ATCC 43381]UPA17284.1 variable large family protein [Borrelia coriaceae]